MLKKNNRISNRFLLSKLFKKGGLYKNRLFAFRYLPSIEETSRFAIVVSGKSVKKAVDRNHLRRQISEAVRLNQHTLKTHIVANVILKPNDRTPKYEEIVRGVVDFFAQVSLNDTVPNEKKPDAK